MDIPKKRLFIFCDGTWQDGVNNICRPTNVATLARCISPVDQDNCLQLVYYDCGVGNGTSKVTEGIDGATGRGISAKIRNAYSFLSHNYNFDRLGTDEEDEIVLVGFSRGAFAVQCLASFLSHTGLLQCQHLYYLRGMFTLWSNQDFKRWGSENPKPVKAKLDYYIPKLKGENLLHEVKIKALLVWDTVSALGLPIQPPPRPLAFVGKQVPGIVENAFQALALDERRRIFKPQVWTSKEPGVQCVKQCWFLGSHSDVGGNGDAALGAVTLLWMVGQLKSAETGVAIEKAEIAKHLNHKFLEWDFNVNRVLGQFKEKSVLSSTSGPGKPTQPAVFWWFLGMGPRDKYFKAKTRDAHPVLMEIHFTVRLALAGGVSHCSVLKNWKTDFQDNQAIWKFGEEKVPECALIMGDTRGDTGGDIDGELDEYNWLKAWCVGKFVTEQTDRSQFAGELKGLVIENGVSYGRLNSFAEMLKEKMKVKEGRLAWSAKYPPQ